MKKRIIPVCLLVLSSYLLYANSTDQWKHQLQKYSKIYAKIKEIYPNKLNEEKIVFSSIQGFLKNLDPHSYFLDPLSLRSMNEDQQGNYFGIGIRITKYEDKLTVVAPLKGTPAHGLGILAGDVIIEINGKKTKNLKLNDSMKLLRGSKGTFVNIKIKRDHIAKLIPYRIQRAEIPLDSISYSLKHPLNGKIGYINIRTFGNRTVTELEENLNQLIRDHQIKGLILDLRGNSGGSLYAAVDISDLFLEKSKVIVSVKGRKLQRTFTAKYKNKYSQYPLVVLINRTSASASEIVAAALQYHKKATIVGSRSWGKGLVETLHKLSMNSAVALTSAKYYTPANKCLQRDFTRLDEYYEVPYKKNYDSARNIEGGVFPDLFVKSETYPPLMVRFISKGLFFKFARKLILEHYPVNTSFKASKSVIKRFKYFLKNLKIKYDQKKFNQQAKLVKYEIEKEILTIKFSQDEGMKVFLRTDPVSIKAIDILKNQISMETKNGKQ